MRKFKPGDQVKVSKHNKSERGLYYYRRYGKLVGKVVGDGGEGLLYVDFGTGRNVGIFYHRLRLYRRNNDEV